MLPTWIRIFAWIKEHTFSGVEGKPVRTVMPNWLYRDQRRRRILQKIRYRPGQHQVFWFKPNVKLPGFSVWFPELDILVKTVSKFMLADKLPICGKRFWKQEEKILPLWVWEPGDTLRLRLNCRFTVRKWIEYYPGGRAGIFVKIAG